MKPKNNDHMNFYECCDLTKKVYLTYLLINLKQSIILTWQISLSVQIFALHCPAAIAPLVTSKEVQFSELVAPQPIETGMNQIFHEQS